MPYPIVLPQEFLFHHFTFKQYIFISPPPFFYQRQFSCQICGRMQTESNILLVCKHLFIGSSFPANVINGQIGFHVLTTSSTNPCFESYSLEDYISLVRVRSLRKQTLSQSFKYFGNCFYMPLLLKSKPKSRKQRGIVQQILKKFEDQSF